MFDDADVEIVDVQFSQSGDIQGFFDPRSGLTFLVAPNLTERTAPAVLLHEATHAKQREDIDRQRRNEQLVLPPDLDYAEVQGLSREVREKLIRHRPHTLGHRSAKQHGSDTRRATSRSRGTPSTRGRSRTRR